MSQCVAFQCLFCNKVGDISRFYLSSIASSNMDAYEIENQYLI